MEINFDEYLSRTGQSAASLNNDIPSGVVFRFKAELEKDKGGRADPIFLDVLQELERQVNDNGEAKIGNYTINFESFGQAANFVAADFNLFTIQDLAFLHFVRNVTLNSDITYYDVISNPNQYVKASDVENAFHKFGEGNEDNVKWVSVDGKEEYIFKETNSGWELVIDPVNEGSYNYIPASEDGIGHLALDVEPWAIFGNFITDSSNESDRKTPLSLIIDKISDGTLEPEFELQTVLVSPDASGVLSVESPQVFPPIVYEFSGDERDNLIFSAPNADVVSGGGGVDTLSFERSTSGVTVNLNFNAAYDGYGARKNAGNPGGILSGILARIIHEAA